MQNLSRQELLDLIDDMRRQIAAGLSRDGDLRFRHTGCVCVEDHYDVAASYRVGPQVRLVGVEQLDGAA
ncbi:hypothetical protein EAO71_27330 [Streptomyces sp. ms191]|uniref:hypothetical protein n=1 Tax=Streptomyces sp. ms191 TaxID=1827978 RepID=UPI0011CDE711|nr:hypothetical protein [Streptomyces sp. ms191]TXS21415.1 hypothetical protein EAO71_27330 [Streptomyces sp. ms191]